MSIDGQIIVTKNSFGRCLVGRKAANCNVVNHSSLFVPANMNLLMNPTDGLLEMWYATPKHLHLCYISLMCDNL